MAAAYRDRGRDEMTGKKRSWAVCVPLCLLVLVGMAGCGGGGGEAPVKRARVTGVTVQAASPREIDDLFEAAGTVKSDSASILASRVMGAVTSLKVREGDSVKVGELLAAIDDRDASERAKAASLAMEAAKVNRDLAKATWTRYRNLYEQKALTGQEMDQVEAALKMAEAEYARAQAMAGEARTALGFTRITAPFSGRVTKKHVDAGSMASPGMPLLTLEGEGSRFVEASAGEGLSGRITAGLPVEVAVDSLHKVVKGRVREVVPAVDAGSRTFLLKVAVDDPALKSGMFARVRIPLGKRTALLVPEASIVEKGQLAGVYVVDSSGVMTYRLIRAGRKSANGVEVLSGLAPNEEIVVTGVEKAIDGGIVEGGRK